MHVHPKKDALQAGVKRIELVLEILRDPLLIRTPVNALYSLKAGTERSLTAPPATLPVFSIRRVTRPASHCTVDSAKRNAKQVSACLYLGAESTLNAVKCE